MATFANMTLLDSAAASHIFAVARRENNLWEWHDRASGVAAGYRSIKMTFRPSSSNNAGTKVQLTIRDPRLAVTAPSSGSGVQPNPVAAYATFATVSFTLPEATDALARADILSYITACLAQAQVMDAVKNPSPPV